MNKTKTLSIALIQQPKLIKHLSQFLNSRDFIYLLSTSKLLFTNYPTEIKAKFDFLFDLILKKSSNKLKKNKNGTTKMELAKDNQLLCRLFQFSKLLPIEIQKTSSADIPSKFRDSNFYRIFKQDNSSKFVVISRCWVDNNLDFIKKIDDEKELDYEKMIKKINLNSENSNLEDSKSCFLKHQMLQKQIQKVEIENEKLETVDFRVLEFFWQKFAIILFHGGDFSLAVFENFKELFHVSDHKYVVRKKGGGKQSNKDGQKSINSIGSQIRRENERILNQNVEKMIEENRPVLQLCHLIFVYSPGTNILRITEAMKGVGIDIKKIRSIGFSTQKAKYAEILNVLKKITQVIVN